MKKQLLIFVMILSMASNVFASEVIIDGLWYELVSESKEAKVLKYKNDIKYNGNIIIPEIVEYEGVNYSVTVIGKEAFWGCTGLNSITIPSSVTSIESMAFYFCIGLSSLIIPNSVTTIGDGAFDECRGLTAISISSSISSLEYFVFGYCTNLTSITIPSSVKSIGSYAFFGCTGLTSITIPNSVTTIGESAFQECTGLTSVTISGSVTSIGSMAFFQCNNLTSVNISELGAWCKIDFAVQTSNPLYYAHHLFLNDKEITDMEIPDNVRYIGEYAFDGCSGFTSVTIPSNVNFIERNAFEGCCGITSVKIANGVKSIESLAFSQCNSLTTITIPSSLTSIGMMAFAECSSLVSIVVESGNSIYDSRENCNAIIETSTNTLVQGCKNTIIPNNVTRIEYSAFLGCSGLTSITIPNSVTTIGDVAFEFTGLTSISIGSGVNIIGNSAFSYCSGLTDVYCYAENVPTTGKDVFQNTDIGNVTLHVPESSVNDYMAAKPWRHFKDIVKIDMPIHTLTYMLDGEVYKTYEIEEGAAVPPEPTPVKEGYTFSGWSETPEIMPAHDVTITGSFSINNYKLTYIVDGVTYQEYELEYGSSITPEENPTKEGYTFSGWSYIPSTMPAEDVTVTGYFSINEYKLIYMVDGEVYKSYEVEFDSRIIPEAEPTKEGYTFSGWSEIPETMPAHDVEITGSFTEIVKSSHDLAINWNETFVDNLGYVATLGQPFDSPKLSNPHGLSPIEWTSSNPSVAIVDANGVLTLLSVGQTQIKATFAGNNEYEAGMAEYSLVVIDSSYRMDNNGNVTIIGGDLTGDVTIDATVTINGQTYQVSAIAEDAFRDNQTITSLTIPAGITTIGNNAFSGCINLIVINIGKDVVSIGSRAFANVGNSKARTRGEEASLLVNCYAESVPYASSDAFENSPIETGKLLVNDNLVNTYKSTSPWSKFGKIYGFNDPSDIRSVSIDSKDAWIFDMQGNKIDNVRKGVNIIRTKDGKNKKIVVKN